MSILWAGRGQRSIQNFGDYLKLPYTIRGSVREMHVQKIIGIGKEQASMLVRRLISPSMRFRLRDTAAQLREQLGRACFWRWKISRFAHKFENSRYNTLYAGRNTHREMAGLLLATEADAKPTSAKLHISKRTAIVSEMPIPGALRVPCSLRVIIPLDRSIDEITAGFGDNLRRLIRKNASRFRMQQVQGDTEIDRANRELLQPYASARHGAAAAQIAPDEVRRLAQKAGRLDFVLLGDEVAACNLGCEFSRNGKRYWSTIRFGYPETVFSDAKRLSETNAISFYLALEWAINHGYDYYDMGTCLARPEDDLLQWKKRWGGELSGIGHHDHFHVRLPQEGSAQFLWDTPLFAAKGNHLTLHLGLPETKSDEDFSLHYRKMNFGGLLKLYIHCARPPSASLLETLGCLYSRQKSPPIIKVIASS